MFAAAASKQEMIDEVCIYPSELEGDAKCG